MKDRELNIYGHGVGNHELATGVATKHKAHAGGARAHGGKSTGVAGAAVDEATIAAGGEDGGDQPTNGDDALFVFPGGVYDFEIQELPEPGQSVNVLIPLSTPIPADGSYRKYTEAGGWVAFVTDTKNALASAAGGADDACPQAGSSSYQSGLNAGHLCLQLTLEDGGPNDADGQVNGVIDDPGGIAAPDADSDGVADSVKGWLVCEDWR